MHSNFLFSSSSPLFPFEDAQFLQMIIPIICVAKAAMFPEAVDLSRNLRHVWSVIFLMIHWLREPQCPQFAQFSQTNFRKLLHPASCFQIGLLSDSILCLQDPAERGWTVQEVRKSYREIIKGVSKEKAAPNADSAYKAVATATSAQCQS